MKKLALITLGTIVAVGITVAPAEAKDSGWGCGGACRHAHR